MMHVPLNRFSPWRQSGREVDTTVEAVVVVSPAEVSVGAVAVGVSAAAVSWSPQSPCRPLGKRFGDHEERDQERRGVNSRPSGCRECWDR